MPPLCDDRARQLSLKIQELIGERGVWRGSNFAVVVLSFRRIT